MTELSENKTKRLFHIQIIFGTSFTFLTSGVFLSGFAMYMGASDLLISYISMIANICGISILLFASYFERFHSLKKVSIWMTICSKLMTLLIVLIPLFIPRELRNFVFVFIIIAGFTLQAQTTVIINNWLVHFVGEDESGRYIARRQTFVLAVTVVLSLTGGRLLDKVSGAYIGFAILFLFAFLMAVLEISILCRIPDVQRIKKKNEENRFYDILRVPVKCKPFLKFVIYIFLFYLFLTIADSFTILYMMRYLELSFTVMTGLQLLISLPQLFLLGIWGKISDKKGHDYVLKLSISFFVGEMAFIALSNAGNFFIMITLAFLFAAVANAGFTIAVFNRRYELMPVERRILFDNFYSAVIGIAFILGPIIGNFIKNGLEQVEWVKNKIQFGNIRLLYGISAVGIIILQMLIIIDSRKRRSE